MQQMKEKELSEKPCSKQITSVDDLKDEVKCTETVEIDEPLESDTDN